MHDGHECYSEGSFKDNQLHGQGTILSCGGRKYFGSVKKGLKHGFGTVQYADG